MSRMSELAIEVQNQELANFDFDYEYQQQIEQEQVELMNKYGVTVESFKTGYKGIHPLELIYWYAGDYFADSDIKKACRYYDLAIEMCGRDANEITFRVIQLGVLASKAVGYLNKNKGNEAKLIVNRIGVEYAQLLSEDLPESVFDYIKTLASIKDDAVEIQVLEMFAAQARAIN